MFPLWPSLFYVIKKYKQVFLKTETNFDNFYRETNFYFHTFIKRLEGIVIVKKFGWIEYVNILILSCQPRFDSASRRRENFEIILFWGLLVSMPPIELPYKKKRIKFEICNKEFQIMFLSPRTTSSLLFFNSVSVFFRYSN